jgi:Methane oxygenase PmoA
MFAFLMRSKCRLTAAVAVALGLAAPVIGADQSVKFTVDAGKHDRVNTPINLELSVPTAAKNLPWATVTDRSGHSLTGQLTSPSLLAKPAAADSTNWTPRELHFILPELKADQSQEFTVTFDTTSSGSQPGFHWQDTAGEYDDLLFGDRPVLRYMYHKLDESSENSRAETFKPYHHVFDPTDGKQLLTKGPGGLWPHHHGVFYGFREVKYGDGRTCDIWHCPDAYQEHSAILDSEAGPVLGRQLLEIKWMGEPGSPDKNNKQKDKTRPAEQFADEKREITVYKVPGGTLLEFASRLSALLPPVHLDGDPQHSGFHFRGSEDVHVNHVKETYYLRTDGKGPFTENGGKGDETRNWDSKSKAPRTINLPWDAMSIVVGGKRYTIAYLDTKKNPKEARFSERDYGRIGSYFVADVTKEKPLDVNYRLWIQDGEMTVPQVAALDADFDDPPTVTLK